MGRMPEQIISALVDTKEGITRPGQSQRHSPGSTYSVCNSQETRGTIKNRFLLRGCNLGLGALYLKVFGVSRCGRDRHLLVP